MSAIRVTIWNENLHDRTDPRVKEIYPTGLHGCIREFLSKDPELEVRTATLDMPECGLPDALLEQTDVLIWWGHMAHEQVPDEQAADSQREGEQKGYWLDFDLNLPKEVPQEENGQERVIYEPGMTAPLPDIDITGYSFAGWGTAAAEPASVIAPGEKIPLLTEDTVLYGIWHKDEENRIPEEYKSI